MTDEEFAQLLALDRELSGVEFKGPGARSDRGFFAQIVRAMLGMANRRDGGIVIVGVEDNNGSLNPVGLSNEQLTTWRYDDVADGVASYADPGVAFSLDTKSHQGRDYVVIEVAEFEDIPVLCKRSYQPVLREGACYVRTRRKPETTEIPTQTEMRDLLDLAIDRGVSKYIDRAIRNGLIQLATPTQDDRELFNRQQGDLR